MTNDTLSRAFDLTRAMQSAADARDWVRVAALVDERSPLLMNLSGEQTPDVLDQVRQIMAIDASITEHAQTDRDRLAAEIEEVLALYDPILHRPLTHQAGLNPHVLSQAFLGIVLFWLGYPDQALIQSSGAIAEARGLAHPPSLAGSLAIGVRLLSLVGDDAALDERAEQLIAVATEQGFPSWRRQGAIYRGWVKVKNGDVAEGISVLRRGSSDYRAAGAELLVPHYFALLAVASEIAQQVEEAVTLLDNALQIVERTGERWLAAELNRHKGQLLLRQGHFETAEELYRKALSIAAEQGAKLWELRAVASLARLRRDQGRRAEARDLLAPIYGWFTEGFATPDLINAKALLDELCDPGVNMNSTLARMTASEPHPRSPGVAGNGSKGSN